MRCRPVGMLKMSDECGIDGKILAVSLPELCGLYAAVNTPEDSPTMLLSQIAHFFEHYKDLEAALRFLETLRASVIKYYKQGLTDYEMKNAVIKDLAEYRDWYNFNEIGRVITFVYQEIERENF